MKRECRMIMTKLYAKLQCIVPLAITQLWKYVT